MKFTALLGATVFATAALAHPLDLPFALNEDQLDEFNDLGKRQSGIVAVTGASGSVQPRLEFRQMESQQPNQFTLLLMAMQQWENASSSSATSYWQIAGIHGVPRVNYNNVGLCSTCSGADGYCTHSSVLFPAWHRTYMALYEQQFLKVVNNIANSWPVKGSPSRATMQKAASTMRWPYWDWAAAPPSGTNNLPLFVSAPKITLNGPTGQKVINNPFYSYKLAQTSNLVYTPFKTWPNTLRYPTSEASDATSNEGQCVTNLNNVRATLQSQVYQLMSTCSDYLYFSNDQSKSQTSACHNSLEGIHNTIHSTTGGVPSTAVPTVGHMFYLSEAAFDPVFFLHHANVDRLFAMWQTINSGSYGASQVAAHNTWTIAKGTTQDANSPLTPFYKDTAGTQFWTTNEVKDWTQFKYTYPEFVDSDGSAAAIKSYVNKLYGPSATATAGSSKRTAIPEPAVNEAALPTPAVPLPVGLNAPSTLGAPENLMGGGPGGVVGGIFGNLLPGLTADNGSTYEYVANIIAPRFVLGGSYYIFLFLGCPASENPDTWFGDSNLVGPMGVLAQAGMEGNNYTIAGSIPITPKLTGKVQNGILGALGEAIVTPFLENALEWRILGPDGTAVHPDTLQGFEVSVFASTASVPQEESCLPEWSDFIPLPSVTKSKAGGFKGFGGFPGMGGGFGGPGGMGPGLNMSAW